MVQQFTSGNLSEEMRTLTWKDICMPMFTAALLKIGKTWTQPKCPLMNEMDKDNTVYTHTHTHTHTHTGILFSHKKETLLCVVTWRDTVSIVLREISQGRTNTDLSFTWNLRNKTKNHSESPNPAHKCREQINGCHRWEVGEMGEGTQRVQPFNHKMEKSWACNV